MILWIKDLIDRQTNSSFGRALCGTVVVSQLGVNAYLAVKTGSAVDFPTATAALAGTIYATLKAEEGYTKVVELKGKTVHADSSVPPE